MSDPTSVAIDYALSRCLDGGIYIYMYIYILDGGIYMQKLREEKKIEKVNVFYKIHKSILLKAEVFMYLFN